MIIYEAYIWEYYDGQVASSNHKTLQGARDELARMLRSHRNQVKEWMPISEYTETYGWYIQERVVHD